MQLFTFKINRNLAPTKTLETWSYKYSGKGKRQQRQHVWVFDIKSSSKFKRLELLWIQVWLLLLLEYWSFQKNQLKAGAHWNLCLCFKQTNKTDFRWIRSLIGSQEVLELTKDHWLTKDFLILILKISFAHVW